MINVISNFNKSIICYKQVEKFLPKISVVLLGILSLPLFVEVHERGHFWALKILYTNANPTIERINFSTSYCYFNFVGSPQLSFLGKYVGWNEARSLVSAAGYFSTSCVIQTLSIWKAKWLNRILFSPSFVTAFTSLQELLTCYRKIRTTSDHCWIIKDSGWIPALALATICVANFVLVVRRADLKGWVS